jgi:alpha-glucoside transport system permease protein
VKPWVFFGPALLIVTVFLIYPLIDTVRASFYGNRFVEGERPFVGWDNYRSVLTNSETWVSLGNNLQWIIVVPVGAVIIGLVVAVLADRLPARSENVTKSIIFVPMAISFVGAAAIWQLIYAIQPPSRNQTGLLNALLGVFGIAPVAWYENTLVNDFALMAIMIWLQAGFAMVLLSAAIKNVPADTIEAARIDGATEAQIFFRVVLPQIASTIVVVLTTILILVLKVFDIVRVTTNGRANTQVIANYFYTFFEGGNYGSAGVVVVLLVLVTIPFMILNIRRFRAQEAMR